MSPRLRASPNARRIAAERGIDLAGISGSGPDGRIVEADLPALAEPVGVKDPRPPAPARVSEAEKGPEPEPESAPGREPAPELLPLRGTLDVTSLIARLATTPKRGLLALVADALTNVTAQHAISLSDLGALGVDSYDPRPGPGDLAALGLGRARRVQGRYIMPVTLCIDTARLPPEDGARLLRRIADAIGG